MCEEKLTYKKKSAVMAEDFSFLILITFFFSLLLLLLFKVTIHFIKSKEKKVLNLPPGSYGWPILGETLEFFHRSLEGRPEKFIKDRMEKYKSHVLKTSLLGENMAILCGPAGNKFLFSNSNKLVTTWWPNSVKKLLGPCITTIGGNEGMQMRKMVLYFFSPDAFIKLYSKTINLVTHQHIKTHWQGKEVVNVHKTIRLFTFEAVCRVLTSIEDEKRIEKLGTLFNIFVRGVISVPINLPGTRFYRANRAIIALKKDLLALVRERRLALEHKTASPSKDLLSHLIACPDENGKFMSESIIVNNIVLLLFAGYDTSSVAITMVIKYLGELPKIYEKVLREQLEIASSKEEGEFLHWEDIQKMKYSWNVVAETIRLFPPVASAYREALVDLKFEGYDIPKGWKLFWNSPLTHMDPNFFPESTKFDPSRFEGAGPIPHSYVPFGGGPRMCLGKEFARLEILVYLHNIVTRFRWKLLIPDEKIVYDITPTPKKGLPIRLHPHNA